MRMKDGGGGGGAARPWSPSTHRTTTSLRRPVCFDVFPIHHADASLYCGERRLVPLRALATISASQPFLQPRAVKVLRLLTAFLIALVTALGGGLSYTLLRHGEEELARPSLSSLARHGKPLTSPALSPPASSPALTPATAPRCNPGPQLRRQFQGFAHALEMQSRRALLDRVILAESAQDLFSVPLGGLDFSPHFPSFGERTLLLGGGDSCAISAIVFESERAAFEAWMAEQATDALDPATRASLTPALLDRERAAYAFGIADVGFGFAPAPAAGNSSSATPRPPRPALVVTPSAAPSPPPAWDGWSRGPFWTAQTQVVPFLVNNAFSPGIKNLRNITGRRLAQDEALLTGKTAWTGLQIAVRTPLFSRSSLLAPAFGGASSLVRSFPPPPMSRRPRCCVLLSLRSLTTCSRTASIARRARSLCTRPAPPRPTRLRRLTSRV